MKRENPKEKEKERGIMGTKTIWEGQISVEGEGHRQKGAKLGWERLCYM